MLVGLIAACATVPDDPAPEREETTDTGWIYVSSMVTGQAPWDPLLEMKGTPIVVDAAGNERTVIPLEDAAGIYAWRPSPELDPGEYHVRDWRYAETLTVEPYGVRPFDASGLVGTTWHLENDPYLPRAGDLLWALEVDDPLLQIEVVEGTSVTFRILGRRDESRELCQVVRAVGTIDELGRLDWRLDEIIVASTPDPVRMEGIHLRIGWLDPGHAGGLEATGVIDTRALGAFVTDDGAATGDPRLRACQATDRMGYACFDCTGDGLASCLDLRLHAGRLVPTDEVVPEIPEPCGVDLVEGGALLGCMLDEPTGSSPGCAGLLLPMAGFPLLRARRRRGAQVPRG
jgi:hypothetical protein